MCRQPQKYDCWKKWCPICLPTSEVWYQVVDKTLADMERRAGPSATVDTCIHRVLSDASQSARSHSLWSRNCGLTVADYRNTARLCRHLPILRHCCLTTYLHLQRLLLGNRSGVVHYRPLNIAVSSHNRKWICLFVNDDEVAATSVEMTKVTRLLCNSLP